MKFTTLIDGYVNYLKNDHPMGLSPSTVKIYVSILTSLRKLFTDQVVEDYKGMEGGKALQAILATHEGSNRTKNSMIRMLRKAYEFGIENQGDAVLYEWRKKLKRFLQHMNQEG